MRTLVIYPQQQRLWCSDTGCRWGEQGCSCSVLRYLIKLTLVNYSRSVFCEFSINVWIFQIYNVSLVFYLCDGFYNRGINHCLFQEVHYVLIQWYTFNIVWRYTYSIRLILIEAKHRYRGKNINRNILWKYSKFKSNVIHKAFSFGVVPSSSHWIRSSAINERNVWTSSTDNETDIFWLIQKGAFVQTKAASDPSLAVLI